MCLMTGCTSNPENTIVSFSDPEEKRIGVTTGSIQSLQAKERFPNAEIHDFSSDADMLEAMRKGKIDAYTSAEALVKYMMAENQDRPFLSEQSDLFRYQVPHPAGLRGTAAADALGCAGKGAL